MLVHMFDCVFVLGAISFVAWSLDLNPDYKVCGEMVKPALVSLKKQEAESVFCVFCWVQVLHRYRGRTAAVRKLEQLFWFGATSDFALAWMEQRLPQRVGTSSLGCLDGDLSFFTHSTNLRACSLSPTNFPLCILWLIRFQIQLSTYVDSIIVHI